VCVCVKTHTHTHTLKITCHWVLMICIYRGKMSASLKEDLSFLYWRPVTFTSYVWWMALPRAWIVDVMSEISDLTLASDTRSGRGSDSTAVSSWVLNNLASYILTLSFLPIRASLRYNKVLCASLVLLWLTIVRSETYNNVQITNLCNFVFFHSPFHLRVFKENAFLPMALQ
jgi:hypothetical protein